MVVIGIDTVRRVPYLVICGSGPSLDDNDGINRDICSSYDCRISA